VHLRSNYMQFRRSGNYSESVQEHSDSEVLLNMLLSQEAVATTGSPMTLRFMGQIQGVVVVILMDSGSSHSFINASIAPLQKNVPQVTTTIKVQVANGQLICCTSEVKQAT
jgi:hypothetical protein